MSEIRITTNKMNHLIDPVLSIWGWEIPMYLFLGGLTAGLMVLSSVVILAGKEKSYPVAYRKTAFWAPVFLNIGMVALGLDLEHKLYLWRFYTTFQVTSPMSWGSWILLIVMPVSILLALGTLREGYPGVHQFVRKLLPEAPKRLKFIGWGRSLFDYFVEFSERNLRSIAKWGVPCGIALGIYTGILLCAMVARPFWNFSILGPLFLASGISAALAFAMLLSKDHEEKLFYGKLDVVVIVIEIVMLALMLLTIFSSGIVKQEAAQVILGGELSFAFWVYVVSLGLLLPLFLEFLEIKGRSLKRLSLLSPILVLFGGYMFRDVVVQAGQITGWIAY